MQILVRTDTHVDGPEKFAAWVEAEVGHALSNFASSITRVDVHLKDERAGSTGGPDITCVMEARVAGLDPLVTSDRATTPGDAVKGSLSKLKRVLDAAIARLREHKS